MSTVTPQFGWLGPEEARREWDAFGENFPEFKITGLPEGYQRPARAVHWDAMKKATGDYLVNVAQEIGDCVSWGCRNAVDHTAACEIAAGERETFKPSFPPYFYGISRVQIGGGRLGNSDGSLGSWAAEGVRKYGVLPRDADGCPDYSGSVAKKWGYNGPPEDFIDVAKPHLIRTTARITNINDLADALANGFSASIASMWGAAMRLRDDKGKSWFTGSDSWPHQMSIIGYDTVDGELCFFRLNSWGPNAHGPQLDGPPGGGWLRGGALDRKLRDSGCECFAFSGFDGFPAQKIIWDAF